MFLHRLPLVFLTLTVACSSGPAEQGGAESAARSGSGGEASGGGATSEGGGAGQDADPSQGREGTPDGGLAEPAEVECSAEVRSCVCDEWQQGQCCTTEWTTFCALTAEQKCGAEAPCTTEVTPVPERPANACCETAATPGCADADVEACVCELLPDCCTSAWDSLCVQLVREQHCAPDVRTCLCEEWQQAGCCDTQWTSFCTITAEEKCSATTTCG